MTIEDIDQTSSFVGGARQENIIKVIGVGGGGNNAISHMFEQGIKHVSFVIINTDRQALNNSPVPTRVLIGKDGLGAGNNPEVAREAAEESAEEIAKLFDDETKMVFITAGMGGGTGTGAAPVVARIAHEKGMLTIGIVTIPFLFEGKKKILKALDGAEEMSKYVDAILVVNNEQLTEIYSDLNWMNAFGKADDTLTDAARSISELITSDGYMNLDFKDVNTTLKDGGAAIISTGYGEGEHRVTKAINDALHSPLLKNRDIFGSKRLLFNLYYSRNAEPEFAMGEANELTSFINNLDPEVDVIYGICFDDSLGNKIKITILAAGFELVIKPSAKQTEKGHKIGAGKHQQPQGKWSPFGGMTKEEPAAIAQAAARASDNDVIKDIYGPDKVDDIERDRAASKYIVLSPEQLENDEVIEAFESTPAFNRDKRQLEIMRRTSAPAQQAAANTPAPAPQVNNETGSGVTPAPDPSQSKIINFED
ncbi:MAG: cell division protein FtsZ [Muribaculaceae bacterium]|nr:cell division protein FtsZ [Muribaculaceae bacterium]